MVVVGAKYRHFRGGVYLVLELASLESTGEPQVVYRNTATADTWVRPLSSWDELITNAGGYGTNVPRFQLLKDGDGQ